MSSTTSFARRALACQRVSRLRGKRAHAPMRATWASCGRAATARSAAGRSPAQLASHGRAPLAGPLARPRTRLRLAILAEFVASRLRACGSSPASLPFAGRPLPPPASANLRAGLRRRDAVSSPRAVFAARPANRVLPSLSARREAAPPAPHATSFSSLCAPLNKTPKGASHASGGVEGRGAESFLAGRQTGRRQRLTATASGGSRSGAFYCPRGWSAAGAREKPRSELLPATKHSGHRGDCEQD